MLEVRSLNQRDHYAKHGGVHFENLVDPAEINQFVNNLPAEKRESFFEVFTELKNAGLIRLVNDGQWADGEGEIGGSEEC